MSMFDLDLPQWESNTDPRMTRAAAVFLFILLFAGCSEAKRPTQPVNEMIESPLQNTVISSFDHYPPRPVTEADRNLVSFTPTGCTDERPALRLLSSEASTEGVGN